MQIVSLVIGLVVGAVLVFAYKMMVEGQKKKEPDQKPIVF